MKLGASVRMPRTTADLIRVELEVRRWLPNAVTERWGDMWPKLEVMNVGPDRDLGMKVSPHWARDWRGLKPQPNDEDATEGRFNIVLTRFSPALSMYEERGEWRVETIEGIVHTIRALDLYTA